MTQQLLTLSEISTQLGLHPRTLYELRKRHADFPAPVMRVGSVSAFDPTAVAEWHKTRSKGGE